MDIHYIQTLYTLMETTRLTAGLQKPERGEIGNAKWALGNEGKGHWGMEGGGGARTKEDQEAACKCVCEGRHIDIPFAMR